MSLSQPLSPQDPPISELLEAKGPSFTLMPQNSLGVHRRPSAWHRVSAQQIISYYYKEVSDLMNV